MKSLALAVHALIAASALVAAGFGAAHFHREIVVETGPVNRLMLAPADAERVGVVHGRALLTPLQADLLPPCLVKFKSGKSWRYDTVHRGARVSFSDGRVYTLEPEAPVAFSRNDGPPGRATPALSKLALARAGVREGTESEVSCLDATRAVYVQACVAGEPPGRLAPCPEESSILLQADGSHQGLIDRSAQPGIAWLSLAVFGALVFANTIWVRFLFPFPIVGALAAHARDAPVKKSSRVPFVVCGLGVFAGGVAGEAGLQGLAVALIATGLLLALHRWPLRFRDLGLARGALRATHTSRLCDDGDVVRELALRVPADAAPVEAPGAAAPALFRAVIREYSTQKGKKGWRVREKGTVVYPKRLAVEDASGRGLLETEHCTFDTQSREKKVEVKKAEELPAWLTQGLSRPLERSEGHDHFEIAWSSIDPGAPLLVYGRIERVRAEEGDTASAAVGYRAGPTTPVIRGESFACAAEEPRLDRAMTRERRAIVVAALLLATADLAALAAVWFATAK